MIGIYVQVVAIATSKTGMGGNNGCIIGFYGYAAFERTMLIVNRGLGLACGVALAVVAYAVAEARDIEMGGDSNYPYSIMAPESAAGHHRAAAASARARHLRSPRAINASWR
jgi:hypothetical protein